MDVTERVSLLDMSAEPATLRLGDKTYTLRRLTLADYAKAEAYMRDKSLQAALDMLRRTPLDDAIVGKAIADICNKPISQFDMWRSVDGEAYLLFRGLQPMDGKPGLTLEQVLALPDLDRLTLTKILNHICNIPEADENPTIVIGNTPTRQANDGTTPLPTSASTTN